MVRSDWGASLGRLLRDASRLDRGESDPVVSARNAIGVVVPLAVGAIAGAPTAGLAATLGSLQTSFADRPGPYRLRVLRMLGTAAVVAVSSGLAVAFAGSDLLSALLMTLIAFATGMALAISQAATVVGLVVGAAALMLGHVVQPDWVPWQIAAWMMVGALFQTGLAVLAWPLGRHGPERQAVAGLYRQLGELARSEPGSASAPPLGDQLDEVRSVLEGVGHDHGPAVEAYRVLLDQAERTRHVLIALSGYVHRFDDRDMQAQAEAVRRVLSDSARVFDEIAEALTAGRPVAPSLLDEVRAGVSGARETLEAGTGVDLTRGAARVSVAMLGGQVRAAVQSVVAGASEGRDVAAPGRQEVRARLTDPLAQVRANLTPGSPVFRHAVRMAVLIGGSDLVTRLLHVERGYWVALTVFVVLRPDFGATFQRAGMRIAGTLAGVLVAATLLRVAPAGSWYPILLVGLFVFLMRLAGPNNLGITALTVAALVIVLLSFIGAPADTTAVPRIVNTIVGGVLCLLAVLVWPVWERGRMSASLADLLDGYRSYTAALADLGYDADDMRRLRLRIRRARTGAQASVSRAGTELVRSEHQVLFGQRVLANSHRVVNALMVIEELRPQLREAGADQPELVALLGAAGRSLGWCVMVLRNGRPAGPAVRMRPVQEELFAALRADPARFGGATVAAALAEASDRVANGVDTLVSDVRRDRAGVLTGAVAPA